MAADGSCVALRLSKAAIAPILEHDPKIAETLSRALAARQAETDASLESHRDRMRRPGDDREQLSLLGKIRTFFKLG